jgi:CRISPR-associated protein Cas7/Cse4/CasC subtype I-E
MHPDSPLGQCVSTHCGSDKCDYSPKELDSLLTDSTNGLDDSLAKRARAALEHGGVKPKSRKKDKESEDDGESAEAISKMLVFLSTTTIGKMASDLKKITDPKKLAEKYKEYIADKPCIPDIALCGRMTEVAKGGLFINCDFTVEAALSAAHAISTHAVVNEVDYFTAADDIPGPGAGHVNEAMFNSACFYKHFAIDWEQLLKNLDGDVELAATTVKCFVEASAKAVPSGKQHSYAAFNCPDGILVEVKFESATPVSYANAFADPVPENTQRGLIGESIARLGQYVHAITDGYVIEADRFWFSPSNRYTLTYVDGKCEKPVIQGDQGDTGKFDSFVDLVMKTVSPEQTVGAAS